MRGGGGLLIGFGVNESIGHRQLIFLVTIRWPWSLPSRVVAAPSICREPTKMKLFRRTFGNASEYTPLLYNWVCAVFCLSSSRYPRGEKSQYSNFDAANTFIHFSAILAMLGSNILKIRDQPVLT